VAEKGEGEGEGTGTPDPRSEAKSVIKEAFAEFLEENKPASKKTNPTAPAWWQTLWGE
jgi:hypothetical protein